MRTVHKFTVAALARPTSFEVQTGARLLHVACQYPDRDDEVTLWFEVAPFAGEGVETRSFVLVGTGHVIPAGAEYCGTGIAAAGQLVWHVYELELSKGDR